MKKIDIPLEQLRLSVSKSKSFKDCKRKFKFRYLDKLPQKDWDHLTFGSLVHKALEDFHLYYLNNKGSNKSWSEVMVIALKAALKEFKGKYTKEMKQEAWDACARYLSYLKKHGFPNVMTCEEDFNHEFENNILLRGFIDRVQMDDDGILHVCDYKTSKSNKYLKGDSFQLLVYAFIMLKKFPNLTKVRGSYMMIRDNYRLVGEDIDKPFEFDREEILSIENIFLNYAVDIRKEKEFAPNPTGLCGYCDYLESCPEGKRRVYNKPVYGQVSWT